MSFLERFIVWLWNKGLGGLRRMKDGDLLLGRSLERGLGSTRVFVPSFRRPQHIALLGKTGTGKTTLLRFFCEQDMKEGRGFIFFDLHGQATDLLLSTALALSQKPAFDPSDRLILIDPASKRSSVGLNILHVDSPEAAHTKAADLVELLKARWHLDTFGARTEELLRNSILVLIQGGLTLVDIEPLLTHSGFRAGLLRQVPEGLAKDYFQSRFESLSEPMKAVVIEPVLNKATAFIADPHIRHILGQTHSTFSFRRAFEQDQQIVINLSKGHLGYHAHTLGGLLLTQLKLALFARRNTKTFTVYCDEIQNLVAFDQGLESLLAEARKFGVSVCSANQYTAQLTPAMRAALLSSGTHLLFQLSGFDADLLARALGEPRRLAQELRRLPQRQIYARIGERSAQLVEVPKLDEERIPTIGFRSRLMSRWGRRRDLIEHEIRERQKWTSDNVNDWD